MSLKEEKDELDRRERGLEAATSKLRIKKEESLRKEIASNFSNKSALSKPSLRDLLNVLIPAYQPNSVTSAQTVTFDSFLANGDRPGGGNGVLNLDSGVFTCFTPGYYTVSFSVSGITGFNYGAQTLHLYKNGKHLTESTWWFGTSDNVEIEVTSSRILVGKSLHESC